MNQRLVTPGAVVAVLVAGALAAQEGYPRAQLILEPPELAKMQTTKGLVILDARGRDDFAKERVAGARWVDEGAWAKAFGDGEDAARWSERIGALGIDAASRVVVLGDSVHKAARVWWILRYWGVEDARLLNGGWQGWKAAALPVETGAPPPAPAALKFTARPRAATLATKQLLLQSLKDGKLQIIDARSEAEHCGTDTFGNKRAGAIPGAKHLDWVDLVDQKTQRFKSAAELRGLFAGAGIDLERPSAAHCQGGGRSSAMVFALELMGAREARNYYRSWAEWSSAADTPVVAGKPRAAGAAKEAPPKGGKE